jgi:hypothetical protein
MSNGQPQTSEKPTAAFVLSLLAGLWMLTAGGMMGGFGRGGMMGRFGWGRNMGGQGGYGQGMGNWMWGSGMHVFGTSQPWFGAIAGVVVLVGAAILYAKPEQRRPWGLVILVVSAIDIFVGMGGLVAGALGVIGGALALVA